MIAVAKPVKKQPKKQPPKKGGYFSGITDATLSGSPKRIVDSYFGRDSSQKKKKR